MLLLFREREELLGTTWNLTYCNLLCCTKNRYMYNNNVVSHLYQFFYKNMYFNSLMKLVVDLWYYCKTTFYFANDKDIFMFRL